MKKILVADTNVKVFEERRNGPMNIDTRLAVLDRIFKLYDDVVGNLETACRKYCADCCTCNVTLTSLEGYRIARHLPAGGQENLFEEITAARNPGRFHPAVTTNGLAELCLQGEDGPEETIDSGRGGCPLLAGAECSVYAVRPFGCRCMWSQKSCRETGYADMDPWVLSVNTVFLQYIEHVDVYGFSGNLTDVLMFMATRENRRRYRANNLPGIPAALIANRPVKVLMIPPEHRRNIEPILRELNNI